MKYEPPVRPSPPPGRIRKEGELTVGLAIPAVPFHLPTGSQPKATQPTDPLERRVAALEALVKDLTRQITELNTRTMSSVRLG